MFQFQGLTISIKQFINSDSLTAAKEIIHKIISFNLVDDTLIFPIPTLKVEQLARYSKKLNDIYRQRKRTIHIS